MIKLLTALFLLGFSAACAAQSQLKALYNSLDPHSIPQHLAFYELYPDQPEGAQALSDAWQLLSQNRTIPTQAMIDLPLSTSAIQALVALVNKQPNEETPSLSEEQLDAIEMLGSPLHNRQLRGHTVTSESAVIALPSEQIDLARALFLSQLGEGADALQKIRSYEATIDLMALQILTRVSFDSTAEEKIRAINRFIFEEMHFRFPPHSLYAKDIDLYTFLPSVVDSRRGVCLGVSILYLCLAQRLALPLEMITPPGHIYVRYRSGDKEINIETTARGIDLPTEEYLGVETRSLQQRTIKEVIGLAHFNQASTFWQNEDYDKAIASYLIAQGYLPEDKLLKELLAYNYLLKGERAQSIALLQQVKDHLPDHAINKETIAEDFLNGQVDLEGVKAYFMQVDEKRESIIKKRDALQRAVERYPNFRGGLQALAVAWIQLHRAGEALEVLERYHQLDPNDAAIEYYLAVLHCQRLHYNQAWTHLIQAEKILAARDHQPKAIKELRRELNARFPE